MVLEEEPILAGHQTGRNSGVIHAGVYYEPGSLKAQFCRQGSAATMRFCEEYGIRRYLAFYQRYCPELTLADLHRIPRASAPRQSTATAVSCTFFDRTDGAHCPCAQCAIARRDVGFADRQAHRRPAGAHFNCA